MALTHMIPLRDVIPSRTRPWVTMGLIVINLAVFTYEAWLPDGALEAFAKTYGLKSYAFWWPTVFTSMFIHGGLLHVISNMYCLWIFGDNVEDQMGHDRFLLFYILCGTTAALGQLLFATNQGYLPMIGASGAVAGVMGAYLFMFPRSEVHMWYGVVFEMPAAVFLPIWFLLQLLGAFDHTNMTGHGDAGDHVAYWAHIGGFLMGVAGVYVFRRPERASPDWYDQPIR